MMVPLASYAADRFTDVPDSNVFHDDITWLADAGVTLGCNPPANDEFCPTDNVRRETMAAFMRRLAVNQVVDAKTAITAENAVNATNAVNAEDADTVMGYAPSDLLRGEGGTATVNTSTTPATADIMTVEAPIAGGILTTLSFNCASFTGSTNTRWDVDITVDGATESLGIILDMNHAEVTGTVYDSATTSAFTAVSAGSHDIGYRATRSSGNGSLDCDISATALFVAFDGTGATPAGVTTSDVTGGADE